MDNDGRWAGFAERIPLLVLNDKSPFITWRNQVLKRLEYFHPYNEDDESMGDLVAREILDPAFKLDGVNQNDLVKRTLESMDLSNNPYVK